MPRVLVSVTNDLSNDQRVHKLCLTLEQAGFTPLLIGRELPDSRPLQRSYATHRLRLFFRQGALFYAEYNVRLFFYLFRQDSDILHSNDLDTLLPNFVVSRLRRKPLVYDTHEYFTGVPELQQRPWVRKVWKTLENFLFPRLKFVFTVNQSIADLYLAEYGLRPIVVRNIPLGRTSPILPIGREVLHIPADAFLLVNQGTGINIDRGMEELLEALEALPQRVHLLLIGKGDVLPALKQYCQNSTSLQERVHFIDALPYEEMLRYTASCDLGLSLDKDSNINYRLSLPNKVFDYVRAGIPLLTTDLPEVRKVVRHYGIGETIAVCSPTEIARAIIQMMEKGKAPFTNALQRASRDLSWEEEVEPIRATYQAFGCDQKRQ